MFTSPRLGPMKSELSISILNSNCQAILLLKYGDIDCHIQAIDSLLSPDHLGQEVGMPKGHLVCKPGRRNTRSPARAAPGRERRGLAWARTTQHPAQEHGVLHALAEKAGPCVGWFNQLSLGTQLLRMLCHAYNWIPQRQCGTMNLYE